MFIWLFPKCRSIFIIGCCVGFMLAAVGISSGIAWYLAALLFIAAALISLFVGNLQAVRMHQSILSWLYIQCRPKEFVDGYKMLLKAGDRLRPNVRCSMLAHLSNAYCAAGDYKRALATLDEMPINGDKKAELLQLGNRCEIFWAMEDADKMSAELGLLKSKQGDNRDAVSTLLEVKLAALRGEVSDAQLELARDTLRTANNELFRLNLKYLLGLIYLQHGNRDFAAQYLQEVSSSGKPITVTQKAKTAFNALTLPL